MSKTAIFRLAILTNYLTPHRRHLFEEIATRIKETRVFLSAKRDAFHDFRFEAGQLDIVYQWSLNWMHSFENVLGYTDKSYINFPVDTWWRLAAFNPNVIITTEFGLRSIQSALYKISSPATTLIIWAQLSERTEMTRGRLRRAIRVWILGRADGVFVNGQSGETYVRSLGYKGPVVRAPYSIEAENFRRDSYAPTEHVRRLLYSGQLIPRKGVLKFCRILVKWCTDHPETTVDFQICGGGEEEDAIRSLSPPTNLRVDIAGPLRHEQLCERYRQSDIYVFPTLGDEWGVVVNEALNSGLPVLGSVHSQAVTELIEDGVDGWKFTPDCECSTYEVLSKALLTDCESLQRMSKNAVEIISQLDPAKVATEVVEAIKSIAQVNERSPVQQQIG